MFDIENPVCLRYNIEKIEEKSYADLSSVR